MLDVEDRADLKQIEIPGDADKAATYLHRLGHAVDWERAAIVAAFVEPDLGHGKRVISPLSRLESATAFAKRGIYGLRTKQTVLRYARAWLVYAGLPRPLPEELVELPDLPFPAGALRPEEKTYILPVKPPDEPEELRQRRLRITEAMLALHEAREALNVLEPDDINDAPHDLLELAMDVADLLRQLGFQVVVPGDGA